MGMEFKRLPGEPIVISMIKLPLDADADAMFTLSQLAHYLDEIDGNVYYISDTTMLDQLAFSDIVMGLGALTRDPNSPLSNKRLKICIVGALEMIKFASESLAQEQYGQVAVQLFSSMEDTLAHVRADMNA